MVETFELALPHGITLSVRAAGQPGRPVLLFLHGFPQGAFVWDEALTHFAAPEHGGWRCIAPNLRGYERSSAPADVQAYRVRHLVHDVTALIDAVTADSATPGRVAGLVAHDWGGAVAWNLAALQPQRLARLVILNSPHPATFWRDLRQSPAQQAASAYMNMLARPDAAARLTAHGYAKLWGFFRGMSDTSSWLTPALQAQHEAVWAMGLQGGLNYYAASPLRPPTEHDPAAAAVTLPDELLHVRVPTLVLWGLRDQALLPGLLDGLEAWVPDLRLECLPEASHWLLHEQPARVLASIERFVGRALPSADAP
ncbi:MAG: alpha/beta fold hydrolase [Tepidimonas ignava]|uniref:Epoxide hydrolase A n=1 Tax=Tepidimonas ignava TaxID=114249 RepID=A0A4R3LGT2_9BURK|nr:alpha/beta fold hydrolase [Tepidimonas ignava]MCX7815206.1 alpha/beta fold hydrolase [Tepidimonas ignava]TCS98708.1 pimeloyl-ACP methyl ester carboxylesterase [Tepidimonas ignava]TSE20365.1 Epoxide hydrolase A [Tepidimonas ignava]